MDHGIAQFVLTLFTTLGYGGIVIAMAIESCCIPLPSELIMPLAGFLAFQQRFNLWGAALAGAVGCVIGSLLAYGIGARGGRPLLLHYGRYVLISPHDLETADRWFARWGDLTVLFSRMLPIVRTFISVPAGIAHMPLWRFTIFSIAGAVPWVMLLVWAGMILGDHWQDLKHQLRGLDYIVAGLIVLGVGFFIWRHVRKP